MPSLLKFLLGPDQTEVCKADQFWSVPNHSIQGAQVITEPGIDRLFVRLITPSQSWIIFARNTELEILTAALNLASTGRLNDWWPNKASQNDQAARSTIDLLKELGELKMAGVITEAEFEAKKREQLARL